MRHPSKSEIATMQRSLSAWFKLDGRAFPWRKHSASAYERIIPEILLQRTRAEVVARFMPQFLKRYPSWKRLATATETELQLFLQPLGLWRRRAASLMKLAQAVAAKNGRLPRNRQDVDALPAVGQYVANAVMLFRYGDPEPLLDVNMARVLERCFGERTLADIRYDSTLQQVAHRAVAGPNAIQLNWAILDLGATICKRSSPRCSVCPLSRVCDFGRLQRVNLKRPGSRSVSSDTLGHKMNPPDQNMPTLRKHS
jgi:A/G-specific adenine glycosylase